MSFGKAFRNFRAYPGAKQDILSAGSPLSGLFALMAKKYPAPAAPADPPAMPPTHQPPIGQAPPIFQPNTTAMGSPMLNPMADADSIKRRKAILAALPPWTVRY